MRSAVAIHEGFMNGSRMILPRVGVGGGVGVRDGFNPLKSSSSSIVKAVETKTDGRYADLVGGY